jgi:YYY domain-containing protein
LFILTIAICAIGLVLTPEVVYVRDIYEGSYARANTMFKFTYQAFMLFGLAMAFIIPTFITHVNKLWHVIFGGVTLVLLLWTCGYSLEAFGDWYGDFTDTSRYKGLDATAFLETEAPADSDAIDWLNENIEGYHVVLEANGGSYSADLHERISAFTGLPTVLGWRTHEWLWRTDHSLGFPETVGQRENDVNAIYTSEDVDEVWSLIDQYNIEYIYVGRSERAKIEDINEGLLRSLGEIVFESDKDSEPSYLVHVGN